MHLGLLLLVMLWVFELDRYNMTCVVWCSEVIINRWYSSVRHDISMIAMECVMSVSAMGHAVQGVHSKHLTDAVMDMINVQGKKTVCCS